MIFRCLIVKSFYKDIIVLHNINEKSGSALEIDFLVIIMYLLMNIFRDVFKDHHFF